MSGNGNGNGKNGNNNGNGSGYVLDILDNIKKEISKVLFYDHVVYQCTDCCMFYINYTDPLIKERLERISPLEILILCRSVNSLNKLFPPANLELLVDKGFESMSSGTCKCCLSATAMGNNVRKRQRGEGNPDCYGKALRYCDRENCRYYKLCVVTEQEYTYWLPRVQKLFSEGLYLLPIFTR